MLLCINHSHQGFNLGLQQFLRDKEYVVVDSKRITIELPRYAYSQVTYSINKWAQRTFKIVRCGND